MSITRNTVYNLAGAMVPVALALIVVPLYIHQIGEDRYGVLTIVWLLLGYFGLFDLGLSRAAANQVARLHDAPACEREEVFWSACLLNAAFGAVGGLLLYLVGRSLLGEWLKMSPSLHTEALGALPWIAAAVPVATISAVLTGALEGRQRFGVVNLIQGIGAISLQVVPLTAAFLISPDLQVIVPVAVVVRVLSVVPLVQAVRVTLPIHGVRRARSARMRELLKYGTWVTVTNIVGPLLDSLDRFFIGGVLGAAAVAYYAVPFSLVGRTQTIPRALSRTLFPYLSADTPEQATSRAVESAITVAAVVIPIVVLSMFLMRPFLNLWMGVRFAQHAAIVGETLLCGIWLNGLATIPFAMLQAQGRPDVVAKFHLAELVPFIVVLWYGLHYLGLVGAAVAWVLRVAVDAVLLFWSAAMAVDLAKRLAMGAALVLCAWSLVRTLALYSLSVRIVADTLLMTVVGAWSLYSSARVRHEVVKVLRYVGA